MKNVSYRLQYPSQWQENFPMTIYDKNSSGPGSVQFAWLWIRLKISCQFVHWIMRWVICPTSCTAELKSRWTALAFIHLNTCSLLDHKWRISLIQDKPNQALRNLTQSDSFEVTLELTMNSSQQIKDAIFAAHSLVTSCHETKCPLSLGCRN